MKTFLVEDKDPFICKRCFGRHCEALIPTTYPLLIYTSVRTDSAEWVVTEAKWPMSCRHYTNDPMERYLHYQMRITTNVFVCVINHMITSWNGGFLPQRASELGFFLLFLSTEKDCLTDSRVAIGLRRHDAHVTSLQWHSLIIYLTGVPQDLRMCRRDRLKKRKYPQTLT